MNDGVISPTYIQIFEHMEKTDPIIVGQFSEETQWYGLFVTGICRILSRVPTVLHSRSNKSSLDIFYDLFLGFTQFKK